MRCVWPATLRLRALRHTRELAIAIVGLALGTMAVAPPAAIAVSPRGDGLIAYSVKTGIYAVRADGAGSRRLVPWQPSTCGKGCVIWKVPRNPRYSPDGRRLTYDLETYVVHNGVGSGAEAGTRTVYVADATGRHRRRLGLGHNPEFSLDGKEVIYLLNPDAYPSPPLDKELPEPFGEDYGPLEAVNIETAARRRISVPGAPEFSPDGQKMLMYRQVKLSDGITWVETLENIDGSQPQNFTLPLFYAEHPRFAAGGELSYDCPSLGNRQPDMCLFNPVTAQHHRLLHIHGFWALEAASSPSGRHFAISGLQGLYVTDAHGHHPRLIVGNGSGPNYAGSGVPTGPDWQPIP